MNGELRALTVRQPWAWAIIHGGKGVENRTRNIAGAYRGPVAIHAGLQIDDAYDSRLISQAVGMLARTNPGGPGLRNVAQYAGDSPTADNSIYEWFGNLGAVIGVVDLVGVHPDCTERVEGHGHTPTCSPWAMADRYHLILTNPRPLPVPIPARGRLGLWRPDADLLAAIREQIGETP